MSSGQAVTGRDAASCAKSTGIQRVSAPAAPGRHLTIKQRLALCKKRTGRYRAVTE